MFTGIVQGQGKIRGKKKSGGGQVFNLEADFDISDPEEGESIAVNGVCLTAYNIRGRSFTADVSPETLSRTKLGLLATGESVNLERALRLADRLGGHLVSGHVDCMASVSAIRPVGDYTLFDFSIGEVHDRYIIEKGSITIDGVSLTVNSCTAGSFSVSIIPHTLKVTTLGELKVGSRVNIEVDIIGKYVEKLLAPKTAGTQAAAPELSDSINPEFLAKHGFW
ncbi:riboflavin synthase [Desulforhopalus singaporensis]|uniref:Riboflavin synthase n=1 Tax=Desulforhopalus singaporensis TaxID=91360 RepID=A0A1H0R9V9_9BACT|nr:riboflavin synthase [Desulforhopalus singaporensis]SDP25796.1 riboflavin synthase alpha chain [Desulforhopalus singaporensis]